ncbi:endonuclease/exonuclease/phosphatase family protein [Chitinibacter fontanus]|uniref:Endonuclease/exonuclease/phosphatase family protein n=1 Tax=Chitinibacter fontanus TaxID=1737446 RepID=A0A7D5VCE2_9NEIS|nr:endonuclease/exonuclease/phosphatase family protein [Chitinibacter fontanus]QLI83118.1 endonuclease/exonuclease/phosphatase family protein [Chitinibacter fontanus]
MSGQDIAERRLVVASYNIHKGLSPLNRHLVLHDVRQALNQLAPDLVFLQEVQGAHLQHARRFATWQDAQHEYLAGDLLHCAYGKNAHYHLGHHGNALLSRFPISNWHNFDLTLHRLEQRGVLHCQLQMPHCEQPLHALCVHLNLRAGDRRKQVQLLIHYIQQHIDAQAPLILAGDFNDWRGELSAILQQQLGMHEVFENLYGAPARSFPVRFPLLTLDRIYVRGLAIRSAQVLSGSPWRNLSDHAPLHAVLQG